MPASRYDTYESDGDSYERSAEIIFTPYSTIEAEVGATFGTSTEFGDSLGIAWEDVEIIDGCLYADLDKQKFKLFSWQDANDMTPLERLERGDEPSADDASEMIRKTYAGNRKEYELVAARVEPVVDDDGETIIEASSKRRDIEFVGDGEAEWGEWEDLGGDVIEHGDAVSWYSASDNGPSVSSRTLAETLTQFGQEAVVDENAVSGWLFDTTGNNVLREDLDDRRVRFFTITQQGEDYTYNLPIVEDVNTGERIRPNNYGEADTDGDSGNGNAPAENDAVNEAAAEDAGDYPEPIADFLSTGSGLNLTEERADNLLTELVESSDNAMTESMIEDYGGREQLIQQVV